MFSSVSSNGPTTKKETPRNQGLFASLVLNNSTLCGHDQADHQISSRKILRLKDLCVIYGISKTKVYYLGKPGSPYYDPTFPQKKRLGVTERSAVGWLQNEMDSWIASLQRGGS